MCFCRKALLLRKSKKRKKEMQNREMNIKKRIVSALMALVMTLALLNSAVITAFAEGTQSADPSTGGDAECRL